MPDQQTRPFSLSELDSAFDTSPSTFNLAALDSAFDEPDQKLSGGLPAPSRVRPRFAGIDAPPLSPLPTLPRIQPSLIPAPPVEAPIPEPMVQPPVAARGTQFDPTRGPSMDQVIGVPMQTGRAAFWNVPTALGEAVTGTIAGHEGEPTDLLSRITAHSQALASGQPQKATWGRQNILNVLPAPQFESGPARFTSEVTRQVPAIAAEMISDPMIAGMGLLPKVGQELLAAYFAKGGVEHAIQTVRDPNATPEDYAAAAVDAVVSTAPFVLTNLPNIRDRLVQKTAELKAERATTPTVEEPVAQPPAVEPAPVQTVEPTAPPPIEPSIVPSATDVLPTGEQQPRLPEAAGVREAEVPTPQFEVPFTLTPEIGTRGAVQPTLREEPHAPEIKGPSPLDVRQPPGNGPEVGTRDTGRIEEPPRAQEAEAVPPGEAPPIVPPKKARLPVNVKSTPREWVSLGEDLKQQTRRILAELENHPPPTRFKFDYNTKGQGGTPDIVGGGAGASVFHDIVTTNRAGKPSSEYETVIDKIRQFVTTGKRSALSDRAVEVAEAREIAAIEGRPMDPRLPSVGGIPGNRLSKPMLPPEAGDIAEEYSRPLPRTQAIQTRVAPPVALKSGTQLRPSEIVSYLSKSLGDLPIRVGRFKQQALGIYKEQPQVVRTKVAKDLDTVAHEIGHHIDIALFGKMRDKRYEAELKALGAATSKPSYTKDKVLKEGAAEFLRLYMMDPASLATKAPTYLDAFNIRLQQHPELAISLREAQKQYQGHLALDPQERLHSHIDFEGKEPKAGGSLSLRMETALVDDLAAIRRAEKDMEGQGPVNILDSGWALARLARGTAGQAHTFLQYGIRSRGSNVKSISWEKALEPIRKRRDDFVDYMVALRVVEKSAQGVQTGIDINDARAVVKKLKSPLFDKVRTDYKAYKDSLLQYMVDGGLMSDASKKQIQALNEYHFPFKRVMDAIEGVQAPNVARRIANRMNPVKRMYGSARDLINPLESDIRDTHAIVDAVEKNKAMIALVDKAKRTTGGGRYLEAIPSPKEVTQFNLQEVSKQVGTALSDAGLSVQTVHGPKGPQLEVDGAVVNLDELVKVFTPSHFVKGDHGIISVIRDGTREFYQVNNRPLFDALTNIGVKQPDVVQRFFAPATRLLRAGATLALSFATRNPVKDTFTAGVYSRYGFRPGYDTLKGLFEYVKKGDDYQRFMTEGGGNAALVSADRNLIREELAKMGLAGRRKFLDSTVMNPINLIRAISEATETATRLGEFKRAIHTEGRTPEGYARAALAARDVTLDFARGGTFTKGANQYVAFFNANAQGMARLGEVFKADPVGATIRAASTITLTSMAAWYLNHDDPEYKRLPAWEKNAYWHIPTGSSNKDYHFIRIPKPFDIGQIFGTVPEVALSWLQKTDPDVARRVMPDKNAAWDIVYSSIPTLFLPAIEAGTNYKTYTHRPIERPEDAGLNIDLRYNRWTSETAKYLGPKIGLAPVIMDHLIYGYTAGLGRDVVRGLDAAGGILGLTPKKPAQGAAAVPVLSAFTRAPAGIDAEPLQTFYEQKDAIENRVRSMRKYKDLGRQGQADQEYAAMVKEFGPSYYNKNTKRTDFAIRGHLAKAADAIADRRRGIDKVFANTTMDPDAKRAELDRLMGEMVKIAEQALGRAPRTMTQDIPLPATKARR